MQSRFKVGVLVLQAEGVVSTVRYSVFLFQTAPTSVVAKPDCRPCRSSLLGCRFDCSGSSGFVGRFLEDFSFNQLVMQVVEIVLHFVVGQLAVDEVSEVVVVTFAVVGFQAVVLNGRAKSYLIKFIFKSHKKTSLIYI